MSPQIPLCNSTMCQRMCMGTFTMVLLANWLFGLHTPMNVVALVTIVILGIGMLGSTTHLGKPGRMLGVLRNPTSHLTLETLTCIPTGIAYLLIAGNGFVYSLSASAELVLEVIGLIASVAFIWVTARAYRLKARPAWNTVFTPINFMLTYLAGGSMGACFAIVATGQVLPGAFLALAAVLFAGAIAGQLFYTYYVGRVGYHIDVKAFGEETRGIYTGWLVLGLAVPAACLGVLFALPGNVSVAAIGMLSYAVSLLLWQAFFFITGKEAWYFPQYDKNISPDYF